MIIISYIFDCFLEILDWSEYQQPIQNLADHTNYCGPQMPFVQQHCLPNNMTVSAPTVVPLAYNTGTHNPTSCSLFLLLIYMCFMMQQSHNSNTTTMNYILFQNKHFKQHFTNALVPHTETKAVSNPLISLLMFSQCILSTCLLSMSWRSPFTTGKWR